MYHAVPIIPVNIRTKTVKSQFYTLEIRHSTLRVSVIYHLYSKNNRIIMKPADPAAGTRCFINFVYPTHPSSLPT